MTMEQTTTDSFATSLNRTATRDLKDDFSRMVFDVENIGVSGVSYLKVSAMIPVSPQVFNWEAAERRADWEENQGRFMEFIDVKDLLSDLHS